MNIFSRELADQALGIVPHYAELVVGRDPTDTLPAWLQSRLTGGETINVVTRSADDVEYFLNGWRARKPGDVIMYHCNGFDGPLYCWREGEEYPGTALPKSPLPGAGEP